MGIGAAIGGIVDAVGTAFAGLGATAAGAIGADAAVGTAIGTGLEGATVGAGLGAAEAGITGGNPLTGALTGGLTGGAVGGLGGAIGSVTGLGATAGDVIAGTGAGALGAAATGQPVLTGALTGGAGGLATGLLGNLSGPSGAATPSAGVSATDAVGTSATTAANTLGVGPLATAGPSAASVAAPSGAGAIDLTSAPPPVGTELSTPDASAFNAASGLGVNSNPNIGLVTTSPAPGAPTDGVASPSLDATPAASALGVSAPVSSPAGSVTTPSGSPGFPGTPELLPDAGGAGVGAGATPPTPGGGFFNNLGSIISGPTGKLLGAGVAGLGLAGDLLKGNSIPGLSNIEALASQSQTQGQTLQNYLATGTLPPQIQASVNAATKDGITAVKAKYAQMGVAPGSSGEVNDIANLQQQSVIKGATLADQLLQQGISESQLSGQLYNDLVQHNASLSAQTGNAIGSLASALAGGGAKIQIGGSQAA